MQDLVELRLELRLNGPFRSEAGAEAAMAVLLWTGIQNGVDSGFQDIFCSGLSMAISTGAALLPLTQCSGMDLHRSRVWIYTVVEYGCTLSHGVYSSEGHHHRRCSAEQCGALPVVDPWSIRRGWGRGLKSEGKGIQTVTYMHE